MDEQNILEQALSDVAASGAVEVHEDGRWLASLDGFRSELRTQGKHTLIHLWSSEANLVRRVVRVSSCEPHHVRIEVTKFCAAKPGCLEFIAADRQRSPLRISREQFKERFGRMLAEQFPDARIEQISTAADLKRSFSAPYTRGVIAERGAAYAFIAAGPWESSIAYEEILSSGLLWLDWTRRNHRGRPIEGLRVFLPEEQTRVTVERASALNPSAGVQIFEFNKSDFRIHRISLSERGNLESWMALRCEIEFALASASEVIDKVKKLFPKDSHALELHVPARTRDVSFRYFGLEFAR